MVGPCLPNLWSLRLVNFSPGSLDYSAESFFSLHNASCENFQSNELNGTSTKSSKDAKNDLLYVSESLPFGSKLNFGFVSLPTLPNHSFLLRVKVWVVSGPKTEFQLFYDLMVDVRTLSLINTSLCDQHGDTVFNDNTIIWNFDGLDYCLQSHIHPGFLSSIIAQKDSKSRSKQRMSYTVDDARHISSLVLGLRDFQESKETLSGEIDTLWLHITSGSVSGSVCDAEKRERLQFADAHLDKLIQRQKSANQALETQVSSNQCAIDKISQAIHMQFPSYDRIMTDEQEMVFSQVIPLRDALSKSIYPEILSVTQQIASVMSEAFPIELAEDSEDSGLYRISGIEFPSSIKQILSVCYKDSKKLTIHGLNKTKQRELYSSVGCVNAGLSKIVQALDFLSHITNIPLKYEMTFKGSHSFLIEHLSPQQVISNNEKMPVSMHVSTEVTYPLYYSTEEAKKHQIQATEGLKYPRNIRFERALALLQRNFTYFASDVANAYAEYHGGKKRGCLPSVPLDCSDHFLWILHYLILFITAPLDE